MNFELLLKVAPVAASAVTLGVAFWNADQGRRKSIADEYASRKRFFDDLKDSELQPSLRELGYQMIAGDRNMTAREVKYLIEADPTGQALRDYAAGKPVLDCIGTDTSVEILFKPSYKKKRVRLSWQLFYSLGYLTCFISTFMPLFVPRTGAFGDVDPIAAVALGCATLLPMSYVALREGARIAKAEKLVRFLNQTLRDRLILEPSCR
ncbi:hypothetical protein [Duganella sp. LjRoot269]|uniref:hypothetical protein n=1 Tax=Duganella sp. LjRoot269 TaxID=3342305 RepID=UPI003ECD9A39